MILLGKDLGSSSLNVYTTLDDRLQLDYMEIRIA